MKKVMAGILASVCAVCVMSCATDEAPGKSTAGDDTDSATPWTLSGDTTNESGAPKSDFAAANLASLPGGINPRFSLSFFSTCINPSASGVGNVVTHAQADACRKFDGSFGGFTSWDGSCTGDVSNCNGSIVCQTHCP